MINANENKKVDKQNMELEFKDFHRLWVAPGLKQANLERSWTLDENPNGDSSCRPSESATFSIKQISVSFKRRIN